MKISCYLILLLLFVITNGFTQSKDEIPLEVETGKGTILYSTMKIIENLGKNPVADNLLSNRINYR